MGKFEETFKSAVLLTGGYYVIDGALTKQEFIKSIKEEYGIEIFEDEITVEYMKFGFPPDNVGVAGPHWVDNDISGRARGGIAAGYRLIEWLVYR